MNLAGNDSLYKSNERGISKSSVDNRLPQKGRGI